MFGQAYELVVYRHNWGEDRVYFHNGEGTLCSLPATWTDAIPPDPFVAVAAGRCHFRWQDLLQLAEMIAVMEGGKGDHV